MNKKKSLLMVISSLLIGSSVLSACSANNPSTISKNGLTSIEKVKNITPAIKDSARKGKIIDVGNGKKGSSVSFKLNLKDIKGFKTKWSDPANTASGELNSKTFASIDHFVVYLISNSESTYPTTGDPIGDSVGDSFNIYPNELDFDNENAVVTFINVQPSEQGCSVDINSSCDDNPYYYYVAVRAVENAEITQLCDECNDDSPDDDIIERNNGIEGVEWSGTTRDTYDCRVAVSSGTGVQVGDGVDTNDTNKIINDVYNDLPVTINLMNDVGAQIRSKFNIYDGTETFTVD